MDRSRASLEFDSLRAEGLRQLERLAGDGWTDFNLHDPGITILEQACYAITDLGYRIDHELSDLLTGEAVGAADSLYSAARILTSAPVTVDDMRRLVLDVDGVKNAWIETVANPGPEVHHHPGRREVLMRGEGKSTQPLRIKGLYRVLIEKSDLADIDGSTVRREVAERLHAHRNLCEDVEDVRILPPQDVALRARVEIDPTEDAEGIQVELLAALSEYLSPHVTFKTLSQMREAGHSIDEIFEGPPLDHGFIDAETLGALVRRSTVHTSDLIRAIMSVPGVRAVRSLAVSSGNAESAWALELDQDRAPRLDLASSEITLERAQLAVPVDLARVHARYVERRQRGVPERVVEADRDLPVPRGRDRAVGVYHSILNHLPDAFGVGPTALPPSASPRRRAEAKQLKAYLLLFDQLLANEFAQLEHVKDLFSFTSDTARSYFSRPVDGPGLDLDTVRSDPENHAERLQEITEAAAAGGLERRNRFLTHLLARFGEEVTDHYLTGLASKVGAAAVSERRVTNKQSFLQRYPHIGSARGSGVDYLRPPADSERSGLEERIRHKLGLEGDEESFFVVEHILLRPVPEDVTPPEHEGLNQLPLLAVAEGADPYSLQLSFVFPEWPKRFSVPGFWTLVERTIGEETPVHLTPHLRRLDKPAMARFRSAYDDWIEHRGAQWRERLGL